MPGLRKLAVTFLAVLAAPSPAAAGHPDLWATVNICDTPAFPDAMGVRASMPGNGTRQRMYMRFHARFFDPARETWHPVEGNGRSRWIYAGTARYRARKAGWTFQFAPPPPGTNFVVRGVVHFEWRTRRKARDGRAAREVVMHKARANTRHGIPNVDEGDPPGTSEGLCSINP